MLVQRFLAPNLANELLVTLLPTTVILPLSKFISDEIYSIPILTLESGVLALM